jgi:hypothetical protein
VAHGISIFPGAYLLAPHRARLPPKKKLACPEFQREWRERRFP